MITMFRKVAGREVRALILLVCISLVSGCAMLRSEKPPVTVAEVVQMSKEGLPPEAIIQKMRDSDAVYRLTAAQLSELHDLGVAGPVLNYMQQTYIEAERRSQNLEDWSAWDMWGPGLW
jgi:hypothetical protein